MRQKQKCSAHRESEPSDKMSEIHRHEAFVIEDLEKATLDNENYREVIVTTPEMQVVLMRLRPRKWIEREVHHNATQFFRIESGTGHFEIGPKERAKTIILGDNGSITIPGGTRHYVLNPSYEKSLHLYTIYAPPQHPPNRRDKYMPAEETKQSENKPAKTEGGINSSGEYSQEAWVLYKTENQKFIPMAFTNFLVEARAFVFGWNNAPPLSDTPLHIYRDSDTGRGMIVIPDEGEEPKPTYSVLYLLTKSSAKGERVEFLDLYESGNMAVASEHLLRESIKDTELENTLKFDVVMLQVAPRFLQPTPILE